MSAVPPVVAIYEKLKETCANIGNVMFSIFQVKFQRLLKSIIFHDENKGCRTKGLDTCDFKKATFGLFKSLMQPYLTLCLV